MKNKDKLKTKKYRGGKCDTIRCSNVNNVNNKNEKLIELCEKLGGITNLIEPFIDKNNPLYKNEGEYTDNELASMNEEYNSIKNNCGVSIADSTSSSASTTNSNTKQSNTNQSNANQSNTNQSNTNQSNICDNNNPIINIADNTNYTNLNNTLKEWISCKGKKIPININYTNTNKELIKLIKRYEKNDKIKFKFVGEKQKIGGTRRRKKTKKRKTNKRKHNK